MKSLSACGGETVIQRTQLDPATLCVCGQVSKLAFESAGCWVVQEALEGSNASDREALVAEMHGHVRAAVVCPHANFVIQKIVETMPTSLANFVAEELVGIAADAARHRYGCRILCRLVEHQDASSGRSSSATSTLIDELIADVQHLCLHSFARHVVNSMLEHGTSEQRRRVVVSLQGTVASYSKRRSASYIVENIFFFCDPQEKESLADELLADSERFLELAMHDAGSHVVGAMLRVRPGQALYVLRAQRILQAGSDRLRASKYGRRLLDEFSSLIGSVDTWT